MIIYIVIPAVILLIPLIVWLCRRKTILQNRWRRELSRLMEQEGLDFIIFDIRSREAYLDDHIQGAIHFPMEEIHYLPLEDMFIHIFVYGSKKELVDRASHYLNDNGYFNVYNIGLLDQWTGKRQSGPGMEIEDFTKILQERKEKERL